MWVLMFFPWTPAPFPLLLLRVMSSTVTSMKIFSNISPATKSICRVAIPHFPKLKFSHLNILWTSQVWPHQLSLLPCFFVILSATQAWNLRAIIEHYQLSFPIHIWSLAKLFLQTVLYLHSYHLWLGSSSLYLLGRTSILVFLPPRLSLLHTHLHPAAVRRSFWSSAFHPVCTLLKILKWLPTVF